jgi:alkanesulfonate monooxygenase SsuD/methylene tetrahydromethanopterin reductase-like flavin-dependent oxidoreductase (luciferase family)
MMMGCVVGRAAGDTGKASAAWRLATRLDHRPQIVGTVEEVSATLRAYAAVGVDRVMLQHLVHEDLEMVSLLGEVAQALRA